MKNVINQVYWDRMSETYLYGTAFKKNAKNEVTFKNKLMPSGKTLISWSSIANYQATKEVPSLPLLLNGQEYLLKISAKIKPENSAIFGIHFFDIQGNEIDKVIFTNLEQKFKYPTRAVKYTIEIINGGVEEINFKKIQISPLDLEEAFNDFYPHSILNKNSQKEGLILLDDSKRARIIAPFKIASHVEANLTIGYLSWQNKQHGLELMKDYINEHKDKELVIFSSSAEIDKSLENSKSLNCTVVYSKALVDEGYHNLQETYLSKIYREPDQVRMVKEAINYFKE
ncbi:accessory Sec system protein Asp3 [Lactobacillus taiwanensis]|uniref:accessory Sec system protein Asp3 n=1 Tax=Lactobacillus taiwanensis TaxID=508451 RepID=UPI00242E209D|nr:accessory Sec system protein Asp3 [Lactobacillus taiwanensis]